MGTKSLKALKGGVFPKAKWALLGMLAGMLLGASGLLFFQNYNPKDEDEGQATVVFERIVSRNELVSASQNYFFVEKAEDRSRLFDLVDIPFTENSFWYRYQGEIKAGINLETAEFSQSGTTLRVSLDAPYIVSNTPDMVNSGVLEENGNSLNPIHVEDVDGFQKELFNRSNDEAIQGGLLEEAKANAEENIRDMFYAALGDGYNVEFIWREGALHEE